jgi:RecA-family ATPase
MQGWIAVIYSPRHAPPRLVPFAEIMLDRSRNYLIQGLIPREGLVVFWGLAKCGKTFVLFDMMLHVALGWLYRGRRVAQAAVVYVACEGERGLGARAEAFRRKYKAQGRLDPRFYLLATRLDLAADADALMNDIAAQLENTDACAVIVIDTLNRSLVGSGSQQLNKGMIFGGSAHGAPRA